MVKSSVAQTAIPPGALITFLQKGLEYIAIEEHINEVCHTLYFILSLLGMYLLQNNRTELFKNLIITTLCSAL